MNYAGFWRRFAAAVIDGVILNLGGAIIGVALGIHLAAGGIYDPSVWEGLGSIYQVLLGWLYFAVMESSPTQGTLGKMVLGIKVTDLAGNRISFGRATGRFFGKMISALILFIGFIMIAFTEKKQGLHDIMAECLVVNK